MLEAKTQVFEKCSKAFEAKTQVFEKWSKPFESVRGQSPGVRKVVELNAAKAQPGPSQTPRMGNSGVVLDSFSFEANLFGWNSC